MPIYEYKCEHCGIFETMRKLSDPVLPKCPYCDGEVSKVISTEIGVVFKGSGFYSTDHMNMKKKARALNQVWQRDNQALLDGDVKGFNEQAAATDQKVHDLKGN